MLANPSFELSGSGGATFGGWNQFGTVGSSSQTTHGARSARVSGPNTGGWDVSAYWQRLDTEPGQQWSASVRVWHTASRPLIGESRAIVNIEWRDAGGNLIDFESYTAADAFTPTDEIIEFTVESGPAPPGTVATHFLLGVLQSPADPSPDVYYDQSTFDSSGPPTLDELQWFDFPGGRTLTFSGMTWRVKGPGFYGPGPNLFCDDAACTWVDAEDRLHLTIQEIGGSWYSTEVTLEEPLGYGDYIFTTVGRLDQFHPTVVLGLFLWQYGACFDPEYGWWNPYNEIDVEISRFGIPSSDVGQFVAQPYDYPGNISRFDHAYEVDERTSYAFRWLSDRVEFRSWVGGPDDETPQSLIHEWIYAGPHIPRPEQPRVHLNLWQFDGPPGTDHEVVIDEFRFVPDGPVVAVPPHDPIPDLVTSFATASPNPFTTGSTITYTAPRSGPVEIVVYDVAGRHVRTLVSGSVAAGDHRVDWNGRDDGGHSLAPGIYLYRYRAPGLVESRRLIKLR
jgi:hypothetical protein